MTASALRARHNFHPSGPEMFLMTNRTGTILHDIRLVKGEGPLVLFEMASLAILIDRIEGDAVLKSIVQHFLELTRRQSALGEQ